MSAPCLFSTWHYVGQISKQTTFTGKTIGPMISDTESGEPQNALTSNFTPDERTALYEFRVGIVT